MSGTAIRREDNTLAWKPGRRLKPSEYALTREAGFKWHKGVKAWVAKRTPEREAFLLKFVSEIQQVTPRLLARPRVGRDGKPLPELVDFRITSAKKRLILFIREGQSFYRKHLDLTREGAGLFAVSWAMRNAVFVRSRKRVDCDDQDGVVYERYVVQPYLAVSVSRDMADLLAQVFWNRKLDLSNWHGQEDVQPIQPHLNAAD